MPSVYFPCGLLSETQTSVHSLQECLKENIQDICLRKRVANREECSRNTGGGLPAPTPRQLLFSRLCTGRLCYLDCKEFSDTLSQVHITYIQDLLKCNVLLPAVMAYSQLCSLEKRASMRVGCIYQV